MRILLIIYLLCAVGTAQDLEIDNCFENLKNRDEIESLFKEQNCKDVFRYANLSKELSFNACCYGFEIFPGYSKKYCFLTLDKIYLRENTTKKIIHLAEVYKAMVLFQIYESNPERIVELLSQERFLNSVSKVESRELRGASGFVIEMLLLSLDSDKFSEDMRTELLILNNEIGRFRRKGMPLPPVIFCEILDFICSGLSVESARGRITSGELSFLSEMALLYWLSIHNPDDYKRLLDVLPQETREFMDEYNVRPSF